MSGITFERQGTIERGNNGKLQGNRNEIWRKISRLFWKGSINGE